MKKSLMILLGVALVSMMVCAGMAETLTSSESSGEVTVSYTVQDSYTVDIPDGIIINANGEASCSVGLDASKTHLIAPDKHLNVYVKSDNKWNLTTTSDDETYSLSYNMMVSAAGYDDLYDHLNDGGLIAGSYAGMIIDSPDQYTVDEDNLGSASILVYSSQAGHTRNKSDLYFSVTDTPEHSGSYTDTLTFTVQLQLDSEMVDEFESVLELL